MDKNHSGNLADNKDVVSASTYTKEFREQIIEVYHSDVYATAIECARSYNVPEKFLYQWLAASRKQTLPPEQSAELARLRKENKRLNQENDILKKAAAYFAKELK